MLIHSAAFILILLCPLLENKVPKFIELQVYPACEASEGQRTVTEEIWLFIISPFALHFFSGEYCTIMPYLYTMDLLVLWFERRQLAVENLNEPP